MTIFNKIEFALTNVWKAMTKSNGRHISAYERYLNESTDVHDLEVRERAWNQMQQRKLY